MLNSIISFHSYLLLNGVVMVGYIAARLILKIPFFSGKISQWQRLKFVRYSLVIIIVAFYMIPIVTLVMPFSYHSDFHLEPILKNSSLTFLQNHQAMHSQLNQIAAAGDFLPVSLIFKTILLMGIGCLLLKYIKTIYMLSKINQQSFCRHKINRVHVLFSPTTQVPFCWSFIKNHFIVIPNRYLENNSDLKLAISHELQHIRQGDTRWLHFLMLVKIICFWNPFIKLWINWIDELQEFSCDESIILRKTTIPSVYAECLINAAAGVTKKELIPQVALGIHDLSQSILYRRVNMLFNYRKNKIRKLSILFAYMLTFFTAVSIAYAFNGSSSFAPLSVKQVDELIKQSHLNTSLQITATPEVVSEINNIRSSEQARTFMRESLARMKQYQAIIQANLKKNDMPNELLAIPLVESGYQPLDQSKNPVLAAGIWQIIPGTAERFNLVVNAKRDDRLDTTLSTKAALAYLNETYKQFNDWKLAVIAYEYGEQQTDTLIRAVGSRDAWVLARSSIAPSNFKKFVSMFDAAVIIIHHPSLISA